jgi:acetyl-CoA acyltransferase
MNMKNAVIVGYARSAFTPAHKGGLAKVRPDDLAANVVRGLLARTKINFADIEDLLLGCAFPEGEQGLNMARLVVMLAGLPDSVAGATINRFCGSSMEAVHIAAGKIALGAGELFIAAGVESMSRVPMTGFNPLPNPSLYKERPAAYMSMGLTAEHVAEVCGISRQQMEEFALASHEKALKNVAAAELIEVAGVASDGCVRADSSLASLSTLAPAFKEGGLVTAGTASPLTDGAAAVIVAAEEYADKNALPKLARIKAVAVAGGDPQAMGLAPIAASRKALERAGLQATDINVAEVNEAFAAQAIPCITQIGLRPEVVNIHGGAIALGHPLGATGVRIVGKAAQLLHDSGGKYALATQCIGGGQGIATVLEKI